MRITYRRHDGNRQYWQSRWDNIHVDSGQLNLESYPGKWAEHALSLPLPSGPVLEAGCGAGRVLLHYHSAGRDIIGMDFIGSTLSALSKYENSLKLSVADINKLPFASNTFGAVLAFGLYHNLENGLDVALRDTHRVLKKEGVLCASFRLDNLQNRLNDLISDFRSFLSPRAELQFHKANYSTGELIELFADSNFKIKSLEYVVNMPLLFKIPLFRDGEFDEGVARAEGYKLKKMPQKVQNLLVKHFPANFCNVAVVTAAAI